VGQLQPLELEYSIEQYLRIYYSEKSVIKNEKSQPEDFAILKNMRTKSLVLQRKRFFQTQDGFVGIGNLYIQPGDKIAILYGSKAPFVVRERESWRRPEERRYRAIGQCYLDG
jgi:hypothetical protein